jgi:hypothetical protein
MIVVAMIVRGFRVVVICASVPVLFRVIFPAPTHAKLNLAGK